MTIVLGAVAYDAKVVPIWEGFGRAFERAGIAFDTVWFSNYERQVDALLSGAVNVAWHSPLAWVQTRRLAESRGRRARAIAMRDTDRDLRTAILVRSDSPIMNLEDLRDRRIAVGAVDSPQATLIPLLDLAERGLEPGRDSRVRTFDVLVGKHGDHIGGERDAARALMAGEVDVACVLDSNQLLFSREGTLPAGSTRMLHAVGPYDHCNFTVVDEGLGNVERVFVETLLAMDIADPEVGPLMEMEGLRRWLPARTSGYALIERAVDRFGSRWAP